MKTYDRRNFHKHTFCIWQEKAVSLVDGRQPDFRSRAGSSYYFTEDGVYRHSDHWARVAHCKWRLEGQKKNGFRLGFAKWTDFHPDNDHDRLYFITVDFEKKAAVYQHRDAAPNTGFLRTAADTSRRIREIRNLLESDDWADYLSGDIEILRKEIVRQLVDTGIPLAQIRRAFLPKP